MSDAQYTVLGEDNSGVVPTDLMQIVTPADAVIIPLEAWFQTKNHEAVQQIVLKFGTFSVAGTGGASVIPQKHNEHLIDSQCTCEQISTSTLPSGTEVKFDEHSADIGRGWWFRGEGKGFIVPVNTALVLFLIEPIDFPLVPITTWGVRYIERGQ